MTNKVVNMPALNFIKQFALEVEAGKKRQTIRQEHKRIISEGDALYLYTGMRTKVCRKLGQSTCSLKREVEVKTNGTIKLDGTALTQRDAKQFAQADGFSSVEELVGWIDQAYGLPFRGVVYYW